MVQYWYGTHIICIFSTTLYEAMLLFAKFELEINVSFCVLLEFV